MPYFHISRLIGQARLVECTRMRFIKLIISALCLSLFFLSPIGVFAQNPDSAFLEGEAEELFDESSESVVPEFQSEEVKARILEIVSTSEIEGIRQALFTAESESGEQFIVNTRESLVEGLRYNIAAGDVVFLQILRSTETGEVSAAYLADVRRTTALLWMVILFAALIVAVGWIRGLLSLLGLAVTLLVLFLFIFPQILNGADAVLVTIIGSIVILGVNMHLSHGFNRSTLLAYASTIAGLVLVYVFASFFVGVADLSGLASEESILLFFHQQEVIIPAGILLAGIILGAVGVLDDIAVTQGETVVELMKANPSLDRRELFVRAMRIGRHHIASTVNTLVLAYVGVAMPLILLFLITPEIDAIRFLNEELVAEEIVRTLAGTMALVLTVPISTLFATFNKKR